MTCGDLIVPFENGLHLNLRSETGRYLYEDYRYLYEIKRCKPEPVVTVHEMYSLFMKISTLINDMKNSGENISPDIMVSFIELKSWFDSMNYTTDMSYTNDTCRNGSSDNECCCHIVHLHLCDEFYNNKNWSYTYSVNYSSGVCVMYWDASSPHRIYSRDCIGFTEHELIFINKSQYCPFRSLRIINLMSLSPKLALKHMKIKHHKVVTLLLSSHDCLQKRNGRRHALDQECV